MMIKKGEMESYITLPKLVSYVFNAESNSASETAENDSNSMSSSSNMAVPASQKLGRPKGSTIKSKYNLAKRKMQVKNYAANKFKKLQANTKWKRKRVKKDHMMQSCKM